MSGNMAQRRQALAKRIAAGGVDAVVVSALPNIRYLCGFTGSNGLLLVRADASAVLFTDPRYEIQASWEANCPVRITRKPLVKALASEIGRERGARRIGFEPSRITQADYEALASSLDRRAGLKPLPGIVEALRMVKAPEEIEAIRRSMAIAAEAFEKTMGNVREGVRESELAAELDYRMRRLGAERPAFETIVLFGENAALPHGRPGQRALRPGELILVDIGAVRDGYSSDMTRMAVAGRPGNRVKRLYQIVLEAQQSALEQLRPGVAGAAVDAVAR
ncbi:MAG: M24 family metallopeptidase, partial [Bryobacteraceae bacterium]